MRVDKDRPSTWRPFDKTFCTQCKAHCCSMPVEIKSADVVRLGWAQEDEVEFNKKKLVKRLKSEGKIVSYRESTDFYMITQKINGDCLLLDSTTRLCTVYEKRPDTCRQFPSLVGPKLGFCPSEKKNF